MHAHETNLQPADEWREFQAFTNLLAVSFINASTCSRPGVFETRLRETLSYTKMPAFVHYAVDGDIAVLTIDHPPVNTMTPAVAEGIIAGIARASADDAVRAVVLRAEGKTFMAGADIKDFEDDASAARLLAGFTGAARAMEDCTKPVVAALHGSALGGGLEIAMAAHYRVIALDGRVGQPEVKLGLIPGAGGTQRLPRLAGVAKALEMCVSGAPINAKDALAAGIVDAVIAGDLLEGALAFARGAERMSVRRTRDRDEKLANASAVLFEEARARAVQTMRGQTAPLAAIEAVRASTQMSFVHGLRREAELFEQCRHSVQSKALIHLFFAERAAGNVPDVPPGTRARPIRRAAVVGAGTMGAGIAIALTEAGVSVRLKETTQAALERGMERIQANYARAVKSGRLTADTASERLARITSQISYEGFIDADLIIEAVFENIEIKKQVFVELNGVVGPECILATNTSSLDVDAMAEAGGRSNNTLGLHFFSPANIMRLVEVVRGKATSGETLATAMALVKRLNKIAVLSGNTHGFIGNRMIEMYGREAQFLLEEGATVEQVNQAIYDFGMPMGPLAMYDLVGNDVMRDIERGSPALNIAGVRRPIVLPQLLERGWLGQKTGRGWSRYGEDRRPIPDPDVAALIEATAGAARIERRRIDSNEIVDRCILALVNEGARLLEEGTAQRASDIDVVCVTGYGFPAWRGGPMFYARKLGHKRVLARIEEFRARHGEAIWTPAPLFQTEAEN